MAEARCTESSVLRMGDIEKRFYDVRVDHLNEDELDYELEVRGIDFREDKSMSRKRRSLRELLKQEKEEIIPVAKMLKRVPQDEIVICTDKLAQIEESVNHSTKDLPPMWQSTLLHLQNRVKLLKKYVELDKIRLRENRR